MHFSAQLQSVRLALSLQEAKRFPAELQLPLFIFILLLLTYRETECASHAALRAVNFSVAFPFCRSVAIKWKVNSILISISCYVLNEKFY